MLKKGRRGRYEKEKGMRGGYESGDQCVEGWLTYEFIASPEMQDDASRGSYWRGKKVSLNQSQSL